jgi:hypothetical protein
MNTRTMKVSTTELLWGDQVFTKAADRDERGKCCLAY